MTTKRIPGGWITWGKSFPSPNPLTPAERADAWLRMKMALWSRSFPPVSAMTLIGYDLSDKPDMSAEVAYRGREITDMWFGEAEGIELPA